MAHIDLDIDDEMDDERPSINTNRFELLDDGKRSPWNELIVFFSSYETILDFIINGHENCDPPLQCLFFTVEWIILNVLLLLGVLIFASFVLIGLVIFFACYEDYYDDDLDERSCEKVGYWFVAIPICLCFQITFSSLIIFSCFLFLYTPLNPLSLSSFFIIADQKGEDY